MGKLDEIKGKALNDEMLDEISGGADIVGDLTAEELLNIHANLVSIYKTKKMFHYDTSSDPSKYNAYLEVVDSLDNVERKLDALGVTYPSRDA